MLVSFSCWKHKGAVLAAVSAQRSEACLCSILLDSENQTETNKQTNKQQTGTIQVSIGFPLSLQTCLTDRFIGSLSSLLQAAAMSSRFACGQSLVTRANASLEGSFSGSDTLRTRSNHAYIGETKSGHQDSYQMNAPRTLAC
jgi:hypothetical protein